MVLSRYVVALIGLLTTMTTGRAEASMVDLSNATVVSADGVPEIASRVLIEEVERRTGVRWVRSDERKGDGAHVLLQFANDLPKEGYRLRVDDDDVEISGKTTRGILYGIGRLIREGEFGAGSCRLPRIDVESAPRYPMRGHQIGYRSAANTYDAWTPEQYEQYIRELMFFGANALELMPGRASGGVMPVPAWDFTIRMSEVCDEYDIDFWVRQSAGWYFAEEPERRARFLEWHDEFLAALPRVDGYFFPGGDGGVNHPRDVMPFFEDLAPILHRHHPNANIWFSLQTFTPDKANWFYDWVTEHQPTWLGGVIIGPQSPPIEEIRARVPAKYPLRRYPDESHTVRCQFPVPWWDPAFALTEGREPPNQRPVAYAEIFRRHAEYCAGHIAYSDGATDDVNKVIWDALTWDPDRDVRDVLIEYGRVFFGSDVAERVADGILALERNWEGPIATNGSIDATLTHWQVLERDKPDLTRSNWRWQFLLLRAYYDAWVRHRVIAETKLESEAYAVLTRAPEIGSDEAMRQATAVLARADTDIPRPEIRARLIELFTALWESVRYQSSVERYGASSVQRSALLDVIDVPVNNRWWLEDQFAEIGGMSDERAKLARLREIADWENPGPGGRYDDVGHVGRSPHVLRSVGPEAHPAEVRGRVPHFMWWDEGRCRLRLSWQSNMPWHATVLVYDLLDDDATYRLRLTGFGSLMPMVNGERLNAIRDSEEIGVVREFEIPNGFVRDGKLEITFDDPADRLLNWRQWARIHEAWLVRSE